MTQGRLVFVLVILVSFLIGFLSCYSLNYVYIDTESPFLIGFTGIKTEPGNWVSEENIEIYSDRIVINVHNAMLSRYADTGSMLPTLGKNANGIKIKPYSPEQIKTGDIISYQKGEKLIVHRVVEKGEDKNGVYFITKGDNNTENDGKIYFQDIKYVTIALIY
jgi:ribosomal protein L27